MKPLLFLTLLVISNISLALVQSDREAKQFLKDQGAGHNDFIEAADSLIIDSSRVTPKGSHCISLPINGSVKKHKIRCFKGTDSDSTTNPGIITVRAKILTLCAVKIKQSLYIGHSFKEIANEILSKKIH